MNIGKLSRTGNYSEVKTAPTRKGMVVIENLFPEAADEHRLKTVESGLYNIFLKYAKNKLCNKEAEK